MHVLHIHPTSATPPQSQQSIAQLARDLGVDFRSENLAMTCVRLAREIQSLRFRLALVEAEIRQPLWRRVLTKIAGESK